MRVIPDVSGLDKAFDYLVPPEWAQDSRSSLLAVGSMVRVPLHGRRVAGWVSELDVEPQPGVVLRPLLKFSGIGPPAELVDLATWAAHRWAGRRAALLKTASPPKMLAGVPHRAAPNPVPSGVADGFDQAFDLGAAVVRVPPGDDVMPLVLAACRRGDALVVSPDLATARRLLLGMRRAGVKAALYPDDWALAAAGTTVVGARSAAWAPMPHLRAVLIVDEHDAALQEERVPTWHARDVVIERARRADVPWVIASPAPTLEALRAGKLLRPSRPAEREGWPRVEVIDRRNDDPMRGGLFSEALVPRLRATGRVVCVLNRTGRSRLLACATCGELVRSEDGKVAMIMIDDDLVTPDGTEHRPQVCASCGSTALKNLRLGVTRAREELEALVGEPVAEVTASSGAIDVDDHRVIIGTEAVLHRVDSAATVVLLDLDQELLAPRQRAAEQAFALVARAARVAGRRSTGNRLVLQTRLPDHEVVLAASQADPSLVAISERDRRKALSLPPYGAQIEISGAVATDFIEAMPPRLGVTVRGPVDGRFLLRGPELEPLLEAIEATPRPAGRLRIAVDPLRV